MSANVNLFALMYETFNVHSIQFSFPTGQHSFNEILVHCLFPLYHTLRTRWVELVDISFLFFHLSAVKKKN